MMDDKEYFIESTAVHEAEHTTPENYKIRKDGGDHEAPAIQKEKELYKEQ
jgi:hypothetical protein